MSQLVPLDQAQLPAHLIGRKVSNADFLAGVGKPSVPALGTKGTRFTATEDGNTVVIQTLELRGVLLAAKPTLDKSYYIKPYDPNNTEVKAPDCYSYDGIKPHPKAEYPQCASCMGCPMNQYKSAVSTAGDPGKGKACRDFKRVVFFVNNKPYKLKITAGSFENYKKYVSELTRYGVINPSTGQREAADLSTLWTVITFDDTADYAKFKFHWDGFLTPEQQSYIDKLKYSAAVQEILGGEYDDEVAHAPAVQAPVVQAPAVQAPVVQAPVIQAPVAPDPFSGGAFGTAPAPEAKPATRAPRAAKPTVAPVEVLPLEVPIAEGDELAALATALGVKEKINL